MRRMYRRMKQNQDNQLLLPWQNQLGPNNYGRHCIPPDRHIDLDIYTYHFVRITHL